MKIKLQSALSLGVLGTLVLLAWKLRALPAGERLNLHTPASQLSGFSNAPKVSMPKLLGVSEASEHKLPNPFNNPQEQHEWNQRNQQLAKLWLSRHEQNVTQDLLKMLDTERTPYLRERIVIALGRLEDPQAEEPLQKLLARVRKVNPRGWGRSSMTNWRDWIHEYRIRLALGRIRARSLTGEKKLNAIAQSVGTSWAGIKQVAEQLRSQLRDKRLFFTAEDSDERQIVEEFYDVLYRMGKRGENIQRLGAEDLFIWSHDPSIVADGLRSHKQRLLLAASLSTQAEIEFWLQGAMPPGKLVFDPVHLLDLGPQAPDELMRYLKMCLAAAKANPQIMKKTSAYGSMFNAAAATGDLRFLPVLQEFQKVDAHWMRIYARRAVEQLQHGSGGAAFS